MFGLVRVRGGAGIAKKSMLLLSAIYSYAIRQGLTEHNPCRDIEKPADGIRDRFLSPSEYLAFGDALAEAINNRLLGNVPLAIIVAALTGMRRGEVISLTNNAIDTDGRCLRLRETKTGSQMRPCGRVALQLLQDVSRGAASARVFPAGSSIGHIINTRKSMVTLTGNAGLEEVTMHVLRHSYATVAHELGYSELTIAGLLGHRLGSVTSRYAHHVDHALADAADRVSETVFERLRPSLADALKLVRSVRVSEGV